MLSYRTVLKSGQAQFKDSGSKHLGFSFHCKSTDEAKALIETIREEHSKANHVCFAYRILKDESDSSFSSDDGEPKNSAGPPILGQILSNDLRNTLVAVVRYFGGTKLGIPGLINAYKTTSQMAIENAEIGIYEIEYRIAFTVLYEKYHIIKDLLNKFEHHVLEEEHTDTGATIKITLKKSQVKDAVLHIKPHTSLFEVEK